MPGNSSRDRGGGRGAGRGENRNVAERLDAKLNEKVIKGTEKLARHTEKHLQQLDRLSSHLEMLDMWTRTEPAARRPRFTRETIAMTAIRIADHEGFDAVSMRRIAADLDAGTMTLYHYVRTKDELLALITDTLMGELVVPEGEMPADWRGAVTMIAQRSRAMIKRHSWILDIADDPNIGPNSVRHFDQSLQAVASLDVDLRDKLDLITVIDEYVFGYCIHERTTFHDDAPGAVSHDMIQYVDELVANGDYPQLAALIAEQGSQEAWSIVNRHTADADRFDRNLRRILDGFEADFAPARCVVTDDPNGARDRAEPPALRYDQRPADETPITTADLPPTPTRDRNIVATAWLEAPAELLALGNELEGKPVATFKRRIGPWLLWRAGPATDADAWYWAADVGDLTRQMTFRLFPDGTGDGIGPSGRRHTRFRTWKEDLLGRTVSD